MSEAETVKDHKDFFISYTSADHPWAEWIAWQLEEQGYRTIIQAWHFHAGDSFVQRMDEALKQAEWVLAIFSPNYFDSRYATDEWRAAYRRGTLLPVRIQDCHEQLAGLLGPLVYINLVGLDEQQARERLLAGVRHESKKPKSSPPFPSSASPIASRPVFPGSRSTLWNIPYAHNPFFTGREEVLSRLEKQLQTGQPSARSEPQAISGLGGIGKTQIAVEYAYRHRQAYQAVLWARAESPEMLTSSFVEIAALLDLPQKDARDQTLTIQAVKNWLQTHGEWLLILDNVDDLALVREFVPTVFGGHILLTIHALATGTLARPIKVEAMSQNTGTLFLLRRASLIASDALLSDAEPSDVAIARRIVKELGGLPLALDQAGAYIEEVQCGLLDYQRHYRTHRARLLKRRGKLVVDHPKPVATTWSLSFEMVKQKSPIAADLLCLCAFLHPDAIPVELITEGATHLGPSLAIVTEDHIALDEAIAILGTYSLIHRNVKERTLNIHRLVQAVLKDAMDDKERQLWAERTVRALNEAFPEVKLANWSQCERYLPHILVCADFVEQEQITLPDAACLFHDAGCYLLRRTRPKEAYPLLQQAYAMREQHLGPEYVDTASTANRLAECLVIQGKYEEAELLYRQAHSICEQRLGAEHLETASSFNNLALFYKDWGKYEEAEQLYKRALAIREQQLGGEHPQVATSLSNLAELSTRQGKYRDAEPLYQHAWAILKQHLGPDHPHTRIVREQYNALLHTMRPDTEATGLETNGDQSALGNY